MSTFQNPAEALVGGIDSIQCIPIIGIASFPETSNLQVAEMEISFQPNYAWLDLPLIEESALYEETESETEHGALYQKDLNGLLPADLLANRQALLKLRHLDLLVKYRDHLGNHKLLNDPSEPLRLSVSFKTESYGGQLGFTLNFSGQHTQPSHFLSLPSLPQFSINALGQLIYAGDLSESFAVNADGQIIASNGQNARYSLDSKGRIVFS
tara:strand:- start:32302 stop:32934 length:633 start_codon:yes stop_codon:yes gene_type:complete